MLFNSLDYLIFFPIVVVIYFLFPHKFRWVILLIASYVFYLSFKLEYGFLIATSTIVSYSIARLIFKSKKEKYKRILLFLNLFINVGLLFFFKYYDFTIDQLNGVINNQSILQSFPSLNWILPIGISFYTFQIIGYTLDVYWGHQKPERHLGVFALFVSFFPQLVAGPIERGKTLLPQFFLKQKFDYDRIRSGLLLIAWGLFQKIVIADKLAVLVNQVYNNIDEYNGLPLIIGAIGFAFQMYCDFAGYTNIAIGSALILGFKLMQNFDRPFSSRNISEFWRRWHISLSTWARDYIFNPIAFNKRHWKRLGLLYAVILTFLFLGIWHGPKLSYLVFGLLMGGAIYFEILTEDFRKKIRVKIPSFIYNKLSVILTFCFFVLSSVFFRADSPSEAFIYISKMFNDIHWRWYELGITRFEFFSLFGFILILEAVQHLQGKMKLKEYFFSQPRMVRWVVYILLVIVILNFGEFNENKFIYFDF